MRKLPLLLALVWALGTVPSAFSQQVVAGPLTFQVGDPVAVAKNPAFVAVGDFNSDGIDDAIVSSSYSRKLTILLGSPDSAFSSAIATGPYGISLQQVAVGDLNGDGIPDVAVVDNKRKSNGRVFILLGVGDGTLEQPSVINTGAHPSGLVIGEFDGAPGLDLAVSNLGDDNVSFFFNRGQATFSAANNFPAGKRPTMLVTGAFGGEADIGTADVASMNTGGPGADDVTELLGNGAGGFQSNGNFVVGALAMQIVSADLNNDGVSDIVVANGGPPGSFSVLLNDGTGFFTLSTSIINCAVIEPTGTCKPTGIADADFDRDGNTDLALAMTINIGGQSTNRNVILIFTGNGDGTFTQAGAPIDIPGVPSRIAAGDFDGDGAPDVVLTQLSGGAISSNVRLVKNTTVFTIITPTPTATPTPVENTPSGGGTPATPPGTPKGQGEICGTGSECTTGFCVDGRCCNTACDGSNQRCDQQPPGICMTVSTPIPSPTPDGGGGGSVVTSRSGGCSAGGTSGSPFGQLAMLLVPAALWVGRRRQRRN